MSIQNEDVADVLRRNDILSSYPRKRILQYLIEKNNHPSVLMLHEDLVGEIPGLSKTTVYSTLRLLVKKQIVEEITIEGNTKRYSLYNPQGHAYFRCESCGNLFDISLDLPGTLSNDLRNFEVKSQSVYLSGRCPSCAGR